MQDINYKEYDKNLLPRHIGIIMDGNGRWAKKRGLPRKMGHKVGAEAFERVVRLCQEFNIDYLTVYAFSTENWKRPPEEIDSIMDLLRNYLKSSKNHANENIRTNFIGERSRLSQDIVNMIEKAEAQSAANTGLCINIALNYGGREEISGVCREIAQLFKEGKISIDDIDEDLISGMLYTKGQPDPDLILRPSGEKRISNFMLWQSAYSELVFLDVLWPDFGRKDFLAALEEYSKRNRRFGGV